MPTRIEIYNKKNVYGWSAKVDFILGPGCGFHDLDAPPVSLLWGPEYILRLEQIKINPLQRNAGMSGYRFTIEAEDTACGAEAIGTRLAFGLLSLAVERRWGLSLSWMDSPLPCRVVDRTISRGVSSSAFATTTQRMYLKDFTSDLEHVFAGHGDIPYRVLLSMELFTSSRLEGNSRSKLVMLVSALEALAKQKNLEPVVGAVVQNMLAVIEDARLDDPKIKASIVGQVRDLKRESARQAMLRFLVESGIGPEDVSFVTAAYKARSKIVHEGQRVPELGVMVAKLEDILARIYRRLYSKS